ncbi:MAG: response regulator transcription factor [Opitutaceae bacterium]|nr:response regulator transcription factor [Opitutaceae bacterium]
MTVLVIEDQTMVRELLTLACLQALPKARLHAAGTCAEALAQCRRDPPDLVILDLVLPDGDGLDLLPDILAGAPAAKVIALSSHIDEFTLHRALSSRVHGILDKNEQPVRILREAITTVLAGGQYVSSFVQRLKASVRANPAAFAKILSEREQGVLRLIGEGLTNDQIAVRLGISTSTAKNHRLNIMAKLDMHSTPQLIRYAIEKGFTRIPEGPSRS